MKPFDPFQPPDLFVDRHLGSGDHEIREMLETLGFDSIEDLVDAVVPASIRASRPLDMGEPRGEHEVLRWLREIALKNFVCRSYIGR
jgi:glycine dehydrogenase